MKLALIPPRGWERWAMHSHFHLALAQVSNNKFYDQVYKEASERDDYIVVDNGAAEGTPVGDYKLFSMASRWRANEVVLPDEIRNGEETVRRVMQFERNIDDSAYVFDQFDYMAVAQGVTTDEVKKCIQSLAHLSYVRTIGIPRHLITTMQRRFVRLDLATWIEREFPKRFQIHFLGTNPSVPSEILRAVKETPFVRSVDTSMPFNYAIAGVALTLTSPAIGRPSAYLSHHQNMKIGILRMNIDTMKRWIAGNE